MASPNIRDMDITDKLDRNHYDMKRRITIEETHKAPSTVKRSPILSSKVNMEGNKERRKKERKRELFYN